MAWITWQSTIFHILGHWDLKQFLSIRKVWQMERSHQHPWGPGCEFVVDGLGSSFERFHIHEIHGSPGITFQGNKTMIKKRPKGFRSSKKSKTSERSNISIVNNGILWYFGCKEHGFTTSLLTTGDVTVPKKPPTIPWSPEKRMSHRMRNARKVRDE